MKKSNNLTQKTKFALVLISLLTGTCSYSQINDPAPYCTSVYVHNYNMIDNLKIEGTTLDFGPEGSFTNQNDYAFYNSFSFPSLPKGGNMDFELNVFSVNDMEPIYFSLWIDFNQNNAFESNEVVMNNANTLNTFLPVFTDPVSPILKTITIPTSSNLGTCRARLIRGSNPSGNPFYDATFSLSPCNLLSDSFNGYGNTYDFNIQIIDNNLFLSDKISEPKKYEIFPNPVSDILSINNASNSPIKFVFKDAMGKVVKELELNNGISSISVSDLSDGYYTISSLTDENNQIIEKIVIKH
jgi:hypothetical protein